MSSIANLYQAPVELLRKSLRRIIRWALHSKPSDPYELAEWYGKHGITVGKGTAIYPNVVLGSGFDGFDPIEIGEYCVLTNCSILGHDASTNSKLELRRSFREKVVIGDRCFIGWNAIVLMGVHIGDDCIVGAGAVVTKSFPAGSIIAGNPAICIGSTESLIAKRKRLLENAGTEDSSESKIS